MHKMAKLFLICILYNSTFSFMSKILGTNAVVVKRVHCTYSVIKDRFIQGPKPLPQNIIRTNFPLWPPLLLNRLRQSRQALPSSTPTHTAVAVVVILEFLQKICFLCTKLFCIHSAIRQGFPFYKSPMKFCLTTSFTLPKQSQRSRSIL